MNAYYNEIDPFAASWLRELIKAGVIAQGDVDERSIEDITPNELQRYTQCHFFAGIGVWSYALRQAGWPDDRQVWTGSCPCQPFSAAGKRDGFTDKRHLWPIWFKLIQSCQPAVIFGEQVASSEVIGVARKGEIKKSRISEEISSSASRSVFSDSHKNSSKRSKDTFQFGQTHSGITSAHRSESMRVDGLSIQSEGRINMGQPIARQDRSRRRLSLLQHSSDLSRTEQCFGELGRTKDDYFSSGNLEEATRKIKQFVNAVSREYEKEDRSAWLDLVSSDLEGAGYSIGAVDTCAAGFGAPHIRQRLYFVADSQYSKRGPKQKEHSNSYRWNGFGRSGNASSVEHTESEQVGIPRRSRKSRSAMGNNNNTGLEGYRKSFEKYDQERWKDKERYSPPSSVNGFWLPADWLPCIDGKVRPVKPGSFPLVNGSPNRVGRLRGYGNSLVAPVAQGFIEAYLETISSLADSKPE